MKSIVNGMAFTVLSLILTSCSLKIKRVQPQKKPVDAGSIKEKPALPPKIQHEELSVTPQDNWEVDQIVLHMEGVGVDSFYYLGFLQEFEKQGFHFKKLIATGSACWIAQSWSSEDKGSYAEWQSFKLNSWDILDMGLLDRWTRGGDSLSSFRSKIKPILPSRVKSLFKIDHSCPYQVERAGKWVTMNSKYLDLSEELWIQLQIPQLVEGLDQSSLRKRSGLKILPPNDEELEDSEIFEGESDLKNTLFLTLSNPQVRKEFGLRNSARSKKNFENGLRSLRLEIGHRFLNSPHVYRKFQKRRLFMLEGRKEAAKILKTPSIREFLGLEIANQ